MTKHEKVNAFNCPNCGVSLSRHITQKVPGTFNQYNKYCQKCGIQFEIYFKKGFLSALLSLIAIVFIFLSILFCIEKYINHAKIYYVLFWATFFIISSKYSFCRLIKLREIRQVFSDTSVKNTDDAATRQEKKFSSKNGLLMEFFHGVVVISIIVIFLYIISKYANIDKSVFNIFSVFFIFVALCYVFSNFMRVFLTKKQEKFNERSKKISKK